MRENAQSMETEPFALFVGKNVIFAVLILGVLAVAAIITVASLSLPRQHSATHRPGRVTASPPRPAPDYHGSHVTPWRTSKSLTVIILVSKVMTVKARMWA